MMTRPQQHPPHLGVQVQKEQDAEQEAQEDGQSAMRGMGWSCMRRPSLGTSTALTRMARFFTTGVATRPPPGHHQGGGHDADEGKIQISWHGNLLLILPGQEAHLFVDLAQGLFRHVGRLLGAGAVDALQIALVRQQALRLLPDGRSSSTTDSPTACLKSP